MRAILDVLLIVMQLYAYVVFAAIIFSWLVAFNVVNMRNQAVSAISDVLYRLTEPVLAPIRRRLPATGGLDLSPIVLFLALLLIERIILYYIYPYVF